MGVGGFDRASGEWSQRKCLEGWSVAPMVSNERLTQELVGRRSRRYRKCLDLHLAHFLSNPKPDSKPLYDWQRTSGLGNGLGKGVRRREERERRVGEEGGEGQ